MGQRQRGQRKRQASLHHKAKQESKASNNYQYGSLYDQLMEAEREKKQLQVDLDMERYALQEVLVKLKQEKRTAHLLYIKGILGGFIFGLVVTVGVLLVASSQ